MATDRARVVPLGVAGLLLAALFLVCYAVQVLYVSAPAAVRDGLKVTLRCTWAVFITDYVARLLLAVHKVRFVLRTPFDLAVIALPLMRSVQHRVALHTTGATALIGLTASLAVLDAERAATGRDDHHVPGRGLVDAHHHHDRRLRRQVPHHQRNDRAHV